MTHDDRTADVLAEALRGERVYCDGCRSGHALDHDDRGDLAAGILDALPDWLTTPEVDR